MTMKATLIIRTATAAALSIASHANPVYAATSSLASSISSQKRTISFLSAFASKPAATCTRTYISRHCATRSSRNNQQPHIGKRSTCRKPNYILNYFATPEDNDTTDTVRTPYTIDDTVCPPTDPDKLQQCIEKHYKSLDKYLMMKPIAKHTIQAFDIADEFVSNFFNEKRIDGQHGIIIDSGCGTARSTIQLAKKFPQYLVIGVDRSLVRLSRNAVFRKQKPIHEASDAEDNNDDMIHDDKGDNNFISDKSILSQSIPDQPNVLILRAELADFWRCILQKQNDFTDSNWNHIVKHYLLYPNPYPKVSRLKSRWYAHPAFPLILQILLKSLQKKEHQRSLDDVVTYEVVVRSNWEGYLSEFASSVRICQKLYLDEIKNESVSNQTNETKTSRQNFPGFEVVEIFAPDELKGKELVDPMTNFEKKFIDWGEPVFELKISVQ